MRLYFWFRPLICLFVFSGLRAGLVCFLTPQFVPVFVADFVHARIFNFQKAYAVSPPCTMGATVT
jgi:hypothetical protein